jgi:hypothetical protein
MMDKTPVVKHPIVESPPQVVKHATRSTIATKPTSSVG